MMTWMQKGRPLVDGGGLFVSGLISLSEMCSEAYQSLFWVNTL